MANVMRQTTLIHSIEFFYHILIFSIFVMNESFFFLQFLWNRITELESFKYVIESRQWYFHTRTENKNYIRPLKEMCSFLYSWELAWNNDQVESPM